MPPEIQQANAYLRAGQKEAARMVLMSLVRRQPDSELAWLMLSRTVDDPRQRADCLRRALRLNPANEEARRQLEALNEAPPAAPPAASKPAAPPAWTPPALPLFPAAERAAARQPEPPSPPVEAALAEAAIPPTQTAEGKPEASPAHPVQKPARKAYPSASKPKTGLLVTCGVMIALLVCVAGGLGLYQVVGGLLSGGLVAAQPQAPAPAPAQPSAAPAPTQTAFILPPTWTPTVSPTPTATSTVTPTPAPSLTPTFPAPPPTSAALMARIEQEVADLRGLPIQSQPQRYVVSASVVELMLKRELEAGDGVEQLKDEARVLVALNLIKPTYDLVRYAMNGLVDGIGGFYRPETKEIYVLGLRFGGMEHITYSHEFNHALVDQQFDLGLLQKAAQCGSNTDRCEAVKALIEGDATLTMYQWLVQYGTPEDYRDILNYQPPFQGLPEQFPPDYVEQAMGFPYQQGMEFVKKMYDDGNWARVNQIYANPPVSTEQILHPEKYLAGEAPQTLQDPSVELALGAPWRRVTNDVLGEWQTYLMLAYSADHPARRSEEIAKRAAAGWGGDQVQVMYNSQTDQLALTAHWVWDSPNDAREFAQASQDYLSQMYRGAQISRPSGTCWESNGRAACLYTKGSETLWLVAPDQAALDPLALLFSSLTTP